MRKYLNPSCTILKMNKSLFSGKEKELTDYVSGKINTGDKRICIVHPEKSGKSDLLNFFAAYYQEGNALDYLFDFKDEHYGRYDVIKISLKEVFKNYSEDSSPIQTMYYDLMDEIKEEYGKIRFEKYYELKDILRKIYDVTGRQFMIFIDDYDLLSLYGHRYADSARHYKWYISELVPEDNDEHLALVYLSGILPTGLTNASVCLKGFKEYTVFRPGMLTDVLKKNTHSSDVAQIKYLISQNTELVRKYLVPLICGIKLEADLDSFDYESTGERAALAVLSFMGVITHENHRIFLEDEKMRIYLLNSIYNEVFDGGAFKNVFEEEYAVNENLDTEKTVNDILIHNFSLAYKYKLPEIKTDDKYIQIVYYPKDEYRETEKNRIVYLTEEAVNDDFDDTQKVVIKI